MSADIADLAKSSPAVAEKLAEMTEEAKKRREGMLEFLDKLSDMGIVLEIKGYTIRAGDTIITDSTGTVNISELTKLVSLFAKLVR
jgi:hypothetical protein